MHPFDVATRLTRNAEERLHGATSPAYANMVGPFGGTTAAVLLRAALEHPARQGNPIALTVNFASPLADGDFEIIARAVRTNRSTQHWMLELTQPGGIAATATAVFAQRCATWSAPEMAPPPAVPGPDTLPRAEPGGRPPWVQRYDMRFAEGPMPATLDGNEQPDSRSVLWIRDDPPRPIDFASLAAICDSFFPRIFVRRRRIVPIGTVSLTTYFHADTEALAAQADRPVLGVARALVFRHGHFDQSAQIWDDTGRLLASSHQMVYFRE